MLIDDLYNPLLCTSFRTARCNSLLPPPQLGYIRVRGLPPSQGDGKLKSYGSLLTAPGFFNGALWFVRDGVLVCGLVQAGLLDPLLDDEPPLPPL